MNQLRPSICRFCHAMCGVLVQIEGGRAVRVLGDKHNPAYRGYSCAKGRDLPAQHVHPERLRRSVKRQGDGSYAPIAVPTAIGEIGARIARIIERHGPRAVALYGGTYSFPYPETVPVANAWMDAIGSPMRFSSASIDQPGKLLAAALHGTWSAGTHAFADADTCLLAGINPLNSKSGGIPNANPAWHLTRARKRGLKLVVIDPRRSETARYADVHLQPRPGQDPVILAGIVHVLIEDGLCDAEFIAHEVEGFEPLRLAVAPFTPEFVARRAGVDAADLRRAAHVFGSGRRGPAYGGTGINMAPRGTLTEYLLLVINTLCGRWLRAGEQVPNPGVLLPAMAPRAQALPRAPAWGYGERLRVRGFTDCASGLPTAALAEEILLEGEGQVRALINVGGNPVAAWPDQRRTVAALERLELLVSLDMKLSATARMSHYVIAPKLSFERPGLTLPSESLRFYGITLGYAEPYAQYAPALVAPPDGAEVIEEWEFFYDLARHMGLELTLQTSYPWAVADGRPASAALDMVRRPCTDDLYALLARDAPVPLAQVRAYPHGHVFGDRTVSVLARETDCSARLDVGNETMMRELAEVAVEPTGEDTRFPYHLVSRRMVDVYNSTGQDHARLTRRYRGNPAFMHPRMLAAVGAADGDLVEISSAHDSVLGVAASDADVRPGVVSMAHAFGDLPGANLDRIREQGTSTARLCDVTDRYDPRSGIPRMSALPVHVRRVAGT